MDKGTKILLAIALIGLFLMLLSLGHDFFSKPGGSSSQPASAVSQAREDG